MRSTQWTDDMFMGKMPAAETSAEHPLPERSKETVRTISEEAAAGLDPARFHTEGIKGLDSAGAIAQGLYRDGLDLYE